ncbi:hypothetical protein M8818_001994 [Zalaria obscura]|uniref:Uncharacterized protein n=1 Tax=Zalaria obscura TaxID=2024903 RepID=A0ACC3SJ77_9PEZI
MQDSESEFERPVRYSTSSSHREDDVLSSAWLASGTLSHYLLPSAELATPGVHLSRYARCRGSFSSLGLLLSPHRVGTNPAMWGNAAVHPSNMLAKSRTPIFIARDRNPQIGVVPQQYSGQSEGVSCLCATRGCLKAVVLALKTQLQLFTLLRQDVEKHRVPYDPGFQTTKCCVDSFETGVGLGRKASTLVRGLPSDKHANPKQRDTGSTESSDLPDDCRSILMIWVTMRLVVRPARTDIDGYCEACRIRTHSMHVHSPNVRVHDS